MYSNLRAVLKFTQKRGSYSVQKQKLLRKQIIIQKLNSYFLNFKMQVTLKINCQSLDMKKLPVEKIYQQKIVNCDIASGQY